MKIPNNTTARLYVWLTTVNTPEFSISCTTIDGMESQGWTLLTVKNIDIDLTDLDIDPIALKTEALKNRRESITSKYEQELMLIDDTLRLTKELK